MIPMFWSSEPVRPGSCSPINSVDEAYARTTPFGRRIAHGGLGCSVPSIQQAMATTSEADSGWLASGMGLPRNVRETAAMVYRKAVNKNLIRGRSIEGVVAASLYAACRQCNVPRTLDEVADPSRVGRKEIGRTYRFMTRELKLKLMPTSPKDYVSRFCSELKLSGEVQSRAVEILKEAADKELTSGRGPTGVAAAAIYISSILSNERRTQREVAEVAGVTEVTIRNRYKELLDKLKLEKEIKKTKKKGKK